MNAVIQAFRELQAQGVIRAFALGGASALVFYTEPVLTYDLDFFVILDAPPDRLISLQPIYEYFVQRGHTLSGEQVVIGDAPVQVLVAYNSLVEEAVQNARELPFNGETAPVLTPEYLLAIALQTNRHKDRERARLLWQQAALDEGKLNDILTRHGLIERWNALKSQM
ncbi:MAG: hypothetical protein NZM28_02640 [Fimbriimonadales bacterium]|nr:hypothetical protein [Fimbriimonadales bacterium]